MKVGIGKHNDDKDVNLSTRGLVNALTVEIVDGSGTQVTSFTHGGFSLSVYDYISKENTNSTTETYTYKSGGASGSTVATITVVYTD